MAHLRKRGKSLGKMAHCIEGELWSEEFVRELEHKQQRGCGVVLLIDRRSALVLSPRNAIDEDDRNRPKVLRSGAHGENR